MLAYDPGWGPTYWALALVGVLSLFPAWYIAMIPGRVAKSRSHPQATAITVAGLLGILTFGILWLVALIWAFTNQAAVAVPAAPAKPRRNDALDPVPADEHIFCNQCGARMRKPVEPGRYRCPKCEALMVV